MKKRRLGRLICFAALILSACSTPVKVYPVPALAYQILVPMSGHPGLVMRRRIQDAEGKEAWETKDYDLRDGRVRRELNQLKFACDVNGSIYLIAENSPALIQVVYERECFWPWCNSRKERVIDRIEIKETDRLLNAQTVCYSLEHYPFKAIK